MQTTRRGREADKDGKNSWNGKFTECWKPRNTQLRNGKFSWLFLLEVNGRGFSGSSFLKFFKLLYVHGGVAHFDCSEIKVWIFFSLPFKLMFMTGFFKDLLLFLSHTSFHILQLLFPPPLLLFFLGTASEFSSPMDATSTSLNTLVESLWRQSKRWKKKSGGGHWGEGAGGG